jgi:hypothetical protein
MKLAKYRFVIRPGSELLLPPYKDATFRGGFGHAFKRAVYADRAGDCKNCVLQPKCVYSYVFETAVSAEAKGELTSTNVPHPFVIEPPLEEKQRYGREDTLCFHLILVCRAIEGGCEYFISVDDELLNKGEVIEKQYGIKVCCPVEFIGGEWGNGS